MASLTPEDRDHLEEIAGDPQLHATVLSSLLRHRAPERLRAGDPAPDVALFDAGGRRVELRGLLGSRPALLVFGSYT